MRRINPEKLLGSKWTAVKPSNKEKHFIVVELIRDDKDQVMDCTIEAIYNNNLYQISWSDLKNSACWLQGWQ